MLIQFNPLRAHRGGMWERGEGNVIYVFVQSSVGVTKSIGAHKAYLTSLTQIWVASCSWPFSSHLHARNSYLSLIPEGKMSLLINFYATICHQIVIMEPHRSPFQS